MSSEVTRLYKRHRRASISGRGAQGVPGSQSRFVHGRVFQTSSSSSCQTNHVADLHQRHAGHAAQAEGSCILVPTTQV